MKRQTRVILGISLGLLLSLGTLEVVLFNLNSSAQKTNTQQSITIEDLWKLTNQNRQEPLLLDEHLDRSAQAKCEDMVAKNYYDHVAPDGTTPWVFIQREVGINPSQYLGENLSEGGSTSQEVVKGWMGSPKHKENIQNVAFHNVGFAVCTTKTYPGYVGQSTNVVVQHFSS